LTYIVYMEDRHKIYYKGAVVLGVALIAAFFIYRGTGIGQTKSLEEQGLNEYIDPSKNPKYNQVYNEIIFSGDGVTKEELDNINTVVNLKDNIEEPEAIIGEEKVPIGKVKTGQKIRSISYNSAKEDTKIVEINYYRGKDEVLETKKSKRKELKEQRNQNSEVKQLLTKLDEEIIEEEQKVQKNKGNWDKKIKNKKTQVDFIKTKTQKAVSSNNKELMDILYPSKESIDKLNNEILEERKKIKELGLDKIWKREELKQKIVSMFMPQVKAGYLSNFISTLVIYPRSNIGLRIDLKGNGVYNGNGFHLWTANGGNAQKFKFMDDSGEIKYAGNTNFCLDRDRNEYRNGAKIQLYGCNSSEAQKWVAFPSGEIKPVGNQSYCLDASAGVNQGSTLHLWQCHGGSNQKFQVGEEDFGKFDYFTRLHAASSTSLGVNSLGSIPGSGHALVSMPKYQKSNGKWHITNTFSLWSSSTLDNANDNSSGRTNNMTANGYLNIDAGGGGFRDWENGNRNPGDYGGEFAGYRRTTSSIPKQRFEELKFMNGYKVDNYDKKIYNQCNVNCASYSTILYNKYNKGSDWGDSYNDPDYNPNSMIGISGVNCAYPGNIYNVLK